MINPQHVFEYCNYLKLQYNAGFVQRPTHAGFKIIGEYYTHSGQLLSIEFSVFSDKVETRVYNASKRCIFNAKTTSDIRQFTRLDKFIQKSVVSY